jgi:hypothetical protein
MRSLLGSFVVVGALLLTVPSLSHAMQPWWSEEQLQKMSTHVLTGTVVRVYSFKEEKDYEGNEEIIQRWAIELAVDKVEKGAGPSAGKVAWLRGRDSCWKPRPDGGPPPEGGCGIAPPTAGQRIRVHAKEARDSDGGLDVLTPNGWSVAGK